MSNVNRVTISGRLTRDPELRTTAGGTAVLGMGVAVNDRRKNAQTGQWEDYTNFIDCTMFGNRAESLSRILTKGTLVFIEGKLRWSQWERDGQKRSKIEVIVDEVDFPSRAQTGDGQGAYAPAQGGYAAASAGYAPQPAASYATSAPVGYAAPAAPAPAEQVYDDEIPF
jgi:single-strand DNA-binding protein